MPSPKWLTGNDTPKQHRMSKRQDRRTIRGYRKVMATPGSGNKGIKGDVVVGMEKMIENKTTAGKQITVKLEYLEKLIVDAHHEGKEPIFQFGFEGLSRYGAKDWQAVPRTRMEELMFIEKEYYRLREKLGY